jgi:HprK-related kinase B
MSSNRLSVTKHAEGQASVTLDFGGVPIVVVSRDERLLKRVADYFDKFCGPTRRVKRPRSIIEAVVGPPEDITEEMRPWDGRGKESFADVGGRRLVRKDRTGTLVSISDGRWTVTGDLHRRFAQLVNVVGCAYGMSLLDRGGAMLHSSALVRDGRAFAIVGESGSGKSSVAVRLLERGFDFLSNDRLIVRAGRPGVIAYGLPKLPRVNPGTLLAGDRTRSVVDPEDRRLYDGMSKRELWNVEHKHDLDVMGTLGRRWVPSAPLELAVVLNWRYGGERFTFEPIDSGRALESFRAAAKTFGPFDLHLDERSDNALRAVVRAIPVFRVTGSTNPPALAELIAERYG